MDTINESSPPPSPPPGAGGGQPPAANGGGQPPAANGGGQPPAANGGGRRGPLAAEALGYAGGVLAIAGLLTGFRELWPHPGLPAQLTLSAAAAAVLGVAGALARPTKKPFERLRGGLWTMSVLATAAFTGVLTDQVLHLGDTGVATLVGAVAACCGLALLRWAPSPALELTAFTAGALAASAGTAWGAAGTGRWAPGLSVWLLSVSWAVAAERGYLKPRRTGLFAAAAGLLISTQMTVDTAGGPALALATAVAALATGVLVRRGWLVVTGAIVMVVAVPELLLRYLPHAVAAPLALLAAGAVMVGAALWFSHRHPRGSRGRIRSGLR
jgi:hypothetical protein